jgi:RNA polymerase sigma-70 factor (ECF subfamily)
MPAPVLSRPSRRPDAQPHAQLDPGTDAGPLLRRCASGDREAFRRLYERYGPRFYGMAMRITRQPSLAADAVHDAFVQVWQQAGRFDPRLGDADAWLMTLVRYRALDLARRRGRDVLGYEADDEPDEAPSPLDQLVGSAEAEALRRCLATLDADKQRLIVLAFTDGLSHGELAARLGAPLGTVKSWLRRSLALLRACLQP